jgi:DNA-binding NarL/FixJ family response regulator
MRILIVDDHAILRRGLKEILVEEFPGAQIGEAETGAQATQLGCAQKWDLVILDLNLPGHSGVDVLKDLKRARPRMPVLVLSIYPEDQYAVRVLEAGASGYLTKEMAPARLVEAARKSIAGGRYVSPALAERLAVRLGAGQVAVPHEALSDREFQVLRMIASGRTVGEIGRELGLSVKTVSTYRVRVLEKMGMKTNAELTRYAFASQLIS